MKKTLVVMAAGMGSRFGGLKQIEPVGPNGEFIIDYSVYDAIRCGFDKIVFIIKEENYETFKETIGKRMPNDIEIAYAFQKMDDVPIKIDLQNRVKPLGTGQAVYCARDYIEGNFAIMNADDFYGFGALKELSDFLDKDLTSNGETYAIVSYKLKNTVTDNGAVKRGVCFEENGKLIDLDESIIEHHNGKYIRESIKTGLKEEINGDTNVSMNLLGFPKEFLNHLEEELITFLKENQGNLETKEFLIPDVVGKLLEENKVKVELLETNENWYGVTYKEDKQIVVGAINRMIKDGIYQENLWKK